MQGTRTDTQLGAAHPPTLDAGLWPPGSTPAACKAGVPTANPSRTCSVSPFPWALASNLDWGTGLLSSMSCSRCWGGRESEELASLLLGWGGLASGHWGNHHAEGGFRCWGRPSVNTEWEGRSTQKS